MAWSLTRLRPDNQQAVDLALMAAGRALYLANHFERKCKFVLRIANLETALIGSPQMPFADALASVAKDKWLGPTILDLSSFPPVSADQAEALDAAKDARNFIAHEGALFGPLHTRETHIRSHLGKLRASVVALAHGDDIVSGWVYDIEEKHDSGFRFPDYVHTVEEWVFGECAPNISLKRTNQSLRD